MNKNFIKNPLLIVAIVFGISVATGIAIVFEYKQPDASNLTANIAASDIDEAQPSDLTQGEIQPSTSEPQIKDEEPKVVSKPVVSKPKVTVPSSDPIVKNTNPGSNNVIVSPSSVAAGESVTITVSIPGSGDLSSIWLMDVYLEGPTGLNTARGSIVNIDGEGRRFGSIAIPKDAELGTWIVKTVVTFDSAGNTTSYHYDTDIFATFTVISPQ